MVSQKLAKRLIWYLCGGLLFLIALNWTDEFLLLPALVFGGKLRPPDWRECVMETVAIMAICSCAPLCCGYITWRVS